LNDTWRYDVTSRSWSKVNTSRRPPPTDLPNLFLEPATDTIFLVTFTQQRRDGAPASCTFWTLDLEQATWHRRMQLELPFDLAYDHRYASRTPLFCVGYDPRQTMLVLTRNRREDTVVTQETCAIRVDLSAMPSQPAPQWTPPPEVRPLEWPKPDPAHEQQLRQLPVNEWVKLEPTLHVYQSIRDSQTTAKETASIPRRDWGNVAFDPIQNRFYYFGGGHSTYQVNDVAIYDVAANSWISGVGEHNDLIPPIGWGGMAMGFRGGHHAHHQRNEYQAVAGKMYVSVGGTRGYIGWSSTDKQPGVSWYYDASGGGVWRMKKVQLDLGPGVEEPYGEPHMADADGRIHSLALQPEHRYARKLKAAYYCVFDSLANRLKVRAIPKPWPLKVGEMRSFCLVPDRQQVFYYEYTKPRYGEDGSQRLWRYDIQENRFAVIDCPKLPPSGRMPTLEYLAGQDAMFAVVQPEGKSRQQQEQWIYRINKDLWQRLPLKGATPTLQTPYGQMAYVPHYGVLVNVAKETMAMRIDQSQ
jgi:hypothetical protein